MYYRPGNDSVFDLDGLQADVMRFMAIIAFCLIAILALVKNIEQPAAEAQPVEQIKPQSTPVDLPPPAKKVVPAPEVSVPEVSVPDVFVPEVPAPEISIEEAPEPDIAPVFPLPPLPASLVPEATESEKTLGLRFASDEAFLNLISTKAIRLYAQSGENYYLMSAGFDINLIIPSGALYQLLPGSVPARIVQLFDRNISVNAYFVVLPQSTQIELQRFLQDSDKREIPTGTLVVDREGRLSHEN